MEMEVEAPKRPARNPKLRQRLFQPFYKGLNLARLIAAIPAFVGGVLLTWIGMRLDTRSTSFIDRFKEDFGKLSPADLGIFFSGILLFLVGVFFVYTVKSIERQQRRYARTIAGRDVTASNEPGTLVNGEPQSDSAPPNLSTPETLFAASRQRLLDEAVRLDSLSRRNLILGVMFSLVALLVLAWPLIGAALQETRQVDVVAWITQYYVPRFAVGVLLQFVGFFFLRLYVSNELDLKHNKNEITNIEMRVMAAQLAQSMGDNAAKKDVIKSLSATERNFLLKKGERTISTEALSEYNDMKGILEKIAGKLRSSDAH